MNAECVSSVVNDLVLLQYAYQRPSYVYYILGGACQHDIDRTDRLLSWRSVRANCLRWLLFEMSTCQILDDEIKPG